MGSISLNGVTALTESSGIVQFESGIKHPVGHVVQTVSNTYGFTGDQQITDGTAGSTANLVGPEVSLTLINANAKVLFSVYFSEAYQNANIVTYLYLMGGTVSKGSGQVTAIGSHSSSIIPPVLFTGQGAGFRNWFSTIRWNETAAKPVSYGGLGQCTNTAGQTFYFKPGVGSTGSTTYINYDGNNGFCTLTVQEIQV